MIDVWLLLLLLLVTVGLLEDSELLLLGLVDDEEVAELLELFPLDEVEAELLG